MRVSTVEDAPGDRNLNIDIGITNLLTPAGTLLTYLVYLLALVAPGDKEGVI